MWVPLLPEGAWGLPFLAARNHDEKGEFRGERLSGVNKNQDQRLKGLNHVDIILELFCFPKSTYLNPGKWRNFCTFGIFELLVRLEHFKQELNDPK